MQILTEGTDLDGFFESVARGTDRLLVLDYDGTLAPFRVERSDALPYPGVVPLVRSIMESGRSRVVIVSGRSLDDLKVLLGFDPLPEVYGSHGWEHMTEDGTIAAWPIGSRELRGLREALRFLEEEGLTERAEEKHGTIALHWRGLAKDEIVELRARLRDAWSGLADRYGLALLFFDGGVELRVPGRDKGTALRVLLDRSPEGTVVAYLGDDATDEDAFTVLQGRGLRVLVRGEPRPTEADIRIEPPDELIAFLRRWADACRR